MAGAVVIVAYGAHRVAPVVSPLVAGVLFGVVLTSLGLIPSIARRGLGFCAKRLLRLGIVLIGFRLALGDLAREGLGSITLVVVVVILSFVGTLWLGRRLGCSRGLTLLVASGFSICGASAIAAIEPFADADQDDVALGVALVTLCGSLAIAVLPALGQVLGLHDSAFGFWAGSSVHDVAQVVATASTSGSQALNTAVVIKLARVSMLAPIVVAASLHHRSRHKADRDPRGTSELRRPPVLPLFVLGFLGAIAVRSSNVLSERGYDALTDAGQLCLAMALVGLGTGVHLGRLRAIGHRPLVLGMASWVLIAGLALAGTSLRY